ncbi:NADH-ubiquinone oxidoreductase B18 subunit-domain-containing protein [Irpex lacteus]|nr:NADH-ubiquinone oxidoreductase B18 subunit-domain-containing protein [Irpex lacteus]
MASSTTASQTELKQAKVPVGWRINAQHCCYLNVCRKEKMYLPWECDHERHAYEKCQYDDYVRRMKVLSKQRLAAAEEES